MPRKKKKIAQQYKQLIDNHRTSLNAADAGVAFAWALWKPHFWAFKLHSFIWRIGAANKRFRASDPLSKSLWRPAEPKIGAPHRNAAIALNNKPNLKSYSAALHTPSLHGSRIHKLYIYI